MSDLASNVVWQEILREPDIPHCRAISAPSKWHQEITQTLAQKILGSFRPNHPDLLIIGTIDTAPNISVCRQLIEDIALKPLEASLRLAVIMRADKLLLPAANSLLKLAEEPPSHAGLLFLMEDGRLFLPTLRSRSRFSVIIDDQSTEARPFPQSNTDWVKWLAASRKSDADTITLELEAWANYAGSVQNFVMAGKIERLRLIAGRKNLSVPMLCDLILLTLREDTTKYEHTLDDLR